MKNVGSIIKSLNYSIIKKQQPKQQKECNCRKKGDCSLNGKCLSSSIVHVYKFTVQESSGKSSQYIGLTGGEFKGRYRNHTKSFRHEKHAKETGLSKYIWQLKKREREHNITWEIVRESNSNIRIGYLQSTLGGAF